MSYVANGNKILVGHKYCYLQQQFPTNAEKLIDNIVQDYKIIISAITEIELYCWKTSTENDLKILHEFVGDAMVIELEKEIKLKTAELRKEYKINFRMQLLPQLQWFMI